MSVLDVDPVPGPQSPITLFHRPYPQRRKKTGVHSTNFAEKIALNAQKRAQERCRYALPYVLWLASNVFKESPC